MIYAHQAQLTYASLFFQLYPCFVLFLNGVKSVFFCSWCVCFVFFQVLGAAACTVVSFDFSGSGMSEGDWVTLGYFEQHDVADVLAYLRSNGKQTTARTNHPPRKKSGR